MPESSSSKQVSAKVACEDPHFSNLEILELQRLVDQVLESGECLSFRFKAGIRNHQNMNASYSGARIAQMTISPAHSGLWLLIELLKCSLSSRHPNTLIETTMGRTSALFW